VGTIASDDEGFGIFLDQSTNAALRLKVGEDYQGWRLRSVQGREATLEKDQEVVTLALPQPGAGQVVSEVRNEVRPPPPNAGKLQQSVTSQPRPDRRGR
jgi:general secretion pathway protein N